jgi:hypothetical protein
VSIIVEFFVAPDDESAALVLPTGPRRAFESLSCGNFLPDDAVIEWESLFTGSTVDELFDRGEPRVIAGMADDGCAVFVLSDGLRNALVGAEQARLHEVAELWADLRARDGDTIEADVATEILGDLAGLARDAAKHGGGLYCWFA